MTLASDLVNILKPKELVSASPDGAIVLRDGQSRMELRVVDAPATAAAVRLERIGHSSALRDGPWKRVCDYLLVVESGERLHAIFIELKKTLTEELRPRDQLRRSTPLLAYLRAVCEVESGDGATRSMSKRYFIVAERGGRRLDKQSVKTEPASRVRTVQFGKHDDQDVHRRSDFALDSARGVTRAVPAPARHGSIGQRGGASGSPRVVRALAQPRPRRSVKWSCGCAPPARAAGARRTPHTISAHGSPCGTRFAARRERGVSDCLPFGSELGGAERGSRHEENEAGAPPA